MFSEFLYSNTGNSLLLLSEFERAKFFIESYKSLCFDSFILQPDFDIKTAYAGVYLPSSGVARFHPFGSFRGGSGSVTSIDRISRLTNDAIRPVCAASTVLVAKD